MSLIPSSFLLLVFPPAQEDSPGSWKVTPTLCKQSPAEGKGKGPLNTIVLGKHPGAKELHFLGQQMLPVELLAAWEGKGFIR